MILEVIPYLEQANTWPQSGYHIMAQYDDEKVVVYQSYRASIGNFAVTNQYFGGDFSFTRMTWIKPNFLWMMYRNGWGTKEGQEVVLAVHLKIEAFERYLRLAVYSSYQEEIYGNREQWAEAVKSSNIRLQWDPDHDPYGTKLERRAIQIGIRNEEIRKFSNEDILLIEDVSEFVAEQRVLVNLKRLDELRTPREIPFKPSEKVVRKRLKLN